MNYKHNVAQNHRLVRRFQDYLISVSAGQSPKGILVDDGECAFAFGDPTPDSKTISASAFSAATMIWRALIGFGRMKIQQNAVTGDYSLIMLLSLADFSPVKVVYGGGRIEYHYKLTDLPKIAQAIIDFHSKEFSLEAYRKFDDTWKSYLRMSRETTGEAVSSYAARN